MTETIPVPSSKRTVLAKSNLAWVGFWSAILTAVFAAAFFLIGIFGTPYTAIGHYPYLPASINSTDYLWLYPAFLLAPTFCILIACIHRYASDDKKIFSQIALSFALIYAVLITALYFTQWTVVMPSILSKQTDGLTLFTQYNPHGFFVALESLAYLSMNAALLAVVPIFWGGGKIEGALSWLLVASFAATVGSFAVLSLLHYDIVVFEVVIIAIDSIVLMVSGTLLSVLFRRSNRIRA